MRPQQEDVARVFGYSCGAFVLISETEAATPRDSLYGEREEHLTRKKQRTVTGSGEDGRKPQLFRQQVRLNYKAHR